MNKYKLFIPIGETLELDNGKTITCVEDEPGNIYTKAAQNACSTKRVTRKISEFTVSKCAVTVKTERTVITYISNTLNN